MLRAIFLAACCLWLTFASFFIGWVAGIALGELLLTGWSPITLGVFLVAATGAVGTAAYAVGFYLVLRYVLNSSGGAAP